MASSDEYFNINLPLLNSSAMKCIGNVLADNTARSQYLPSLFGKLGDGHFLTVQADGGKVYVAVSPAASPAAINEQAVGNGNTICWPVPDGTIIAGIPIGGREVATSIVTSVAYNYLHYKCSSGITSYLRFYRSSFAPNQGSEAFPAP